MLDEVEGKHDVHREGTPGRLCRSIEVIEVALQERQNPSP